MKALTIRRLRLSDAEALYRILSDRQVMRYLEPPYDRLMTAFKRSSSSGRRGLRSRPLYTARRRTAVCWATSSTTPMTRTAWSWAGCSPRTAGGRAMPPG